jgi:hypothetical protein
MSDRRILKRVNALLNMAKDESSPREAAIAARRARAIIDKYQIDERLLGKTDDGSFLAKRSNYEYKQKKTWVLGLASACAELNDCCVVLIENKDDKLFVVEFRGFSLDAELSASLNDYLIECCGRELEKADITGKGQKNFFRIGFTSAVIDKIGQITDRRKAEFVDSSGGSLVVLKNQMVVDHFGLVKKRVNSPTIRKPNADEFDSLMKGNVAGKKTQVEGQLGSGE